MRDLGYFILSDNPEFSNKIYNMLRFGIFITLLGFPLGAFSQVSLQFNLPTYVGNLGGYSKHLRYYSDALEKYYNQPKGPKFSSVTPGWGLGAGMFKEGYYFGFYYQSHNYQTDTFATPHIFNANTHQYRLEMRHVGVETGKKVASANGIDWYVLGGLEAGAIRHRFKDELATEWLSQRRTGLSAINNHSSIQLNLGLMADYRFHPHWHLMLRAGWQTGQKLSTKRGSSGFWAMAPLPSQPGVPPVTEDLYRQQYGVTLEEMKEEFRTPMQRVFIDFRLGYLIGK